MEHLKKYGALLLVVMIGLALHQKFVAAHLGPHAAKPAGK